MSSSIAHLVFGPLASGKSTFARKLAKERGAVRFAIDDWMQALYGADKPSNADLAWAMERVDRCRSVIWSTSREILASGREVVLETGLMQEVDRRAARANIEEAGFECKLHFVDAPRELRWQRVMQRNQEKGDTFAFEITPAMFEMIERLFEPPFAG